MPLVLVEKRGKREDEQDSSGQQLYEFMQPGNIPGPAYS